MGELEKSYHNFRIFINSEEHYPPHVHVVDLDNPKNKSRIRIDNGQYLKGDKDLGHGSSKIRKYIRTELKTRCINEWNKLNPELPYKEGIGE